MKCFLHAIDFISINQAFKRCIEMFGVNISNLVKIISILLCSSGLFYQLEQISERYFKFQSRSEIQLREPQAITMPIISTCWYLKEIMGRKWFKSKNEYYFVVDKMTVKEIFDATPDLDYVLWDKHGCAVRLPHQMATKVPGPNRTECMKYFKIKRYLQRDFVCYKFSSKVVNPEQLLDITEYSLTPVTSGIIYRLYMNHSLFDGVSYFTAFTHSFTSSHLYDSLFARTRNYYKAENSTMDNVNIEVSYSGQEVTRLEPPYDTSCHNFYPYSSGTQYLFKKLENETIEKLGRAHTFHPVENDKLDYPIITALSLRNRTFLGKFNAIYGKYNRTRLDCNLKYYITKIGMSFGPSVTISVYWPQDPLVWIDHVPVYDLIDYILYVCSSFGIWFGISVLSVGEVINSLIARLKPKAQNRGIETRSDRDKRYDREIELLRESQKKMNRRMKIGFLALMEYSRLQIEMIEK